MGGGALLALLSCGLGATLLANLWKSPGSRIEGGASIVLILGVIAPIALGGMLIALAMVLSYLYQMTDAIDRMELGLRHTPKPADNQESPRPTHSRIEPRHASDPLEQTLKEVLRALQEIRELSLLPEDERRSRAAELAEDDLAKAESEIRYFIAEGDFLRADSAAKQVAARRPQDPRAAGLPEQVENSRRQHEATDLAGITLEVSDLISMSAWSQARQKVQALQERHPDNAEARQLMLRIEREYRISQDEQQRRLYAEVQRFVSRKRWDEAKAAAYAFVERFAGSDDAEAVRLQIPTLELNAEIELRQRLETEIMDLAKHGRYIDATALAKRVIAQYPDSPQAEALRRQIGRLEELATNPDAPPARVRID